MTRLIARSICLGCLFMYFIVQLAVSVMYGELNAWTVIINGLGILAVLLVAIAFKQDAATLRRKNRVIGLQVSTMKDQARKLGRMQGQRRSGGPES